MRLWYRLPSHFQLTNQIQQRWKVPVQRLFQIRTTSPPLVWLNATPFLGTPPHCSACSLHVASCSKLSRRPVLPLNKIMRVLKTLFNLNFNLNPVPRFCFVGSTLSLLPFRSEWPFGQLPCNLGAAQRGLWACTHVHPFVLIPPFLVSRSSSLF